MADGPAFDLITEVFNQRALLMTFFGALGGSVRAAVLKTTWTEASRVVFIGGASAFGVGVLGPLVMQPWIGDLPEGINSAIGTLTAVAFLTGVLAVTIIERFLAGDVKK